MAKILVKKKIVEENGTTTIFTIQDLKTLFGKKNNIKLDIEKTAMENPREEMKFNSEFFKGMYGNTKKDINFCLNNIHQFPGIIKRMPDFYQNATRNIMQARPAMDIIPKKRIEKDAHWEEGEKELFVQCLKKYGKDWRAIACSFPNKTDKQLRNFFQNNKAKLQLNAYVQYPEPHNKF